MSCYNAPNMTYMTELFNKETIKSCKIPFAEQNYARYLESLVECSTSLRGYSKKFLKALKELTSMVYPLIGKNGRSKSNNENEDPFSEDVNEILAKMRRNY